MKYLTTIFILFSTWLYNWLCNNFKKAIGIESQKLYKQVKDHVNKLKMGLNGCYRAKLNSKTFAFPILTAFAFIMIDVLNVCMIFCVKLPPFFNA